MRAWKTKTKNKYAVGFFYRLRIFVISNSSGPVRGTVVVTYLQQVKVYESRDDFNA